MASSQADALMETLAAMRDEGRLSEQDGALVAMAEGLAAALDDDPSNAALWREYRAALSAVKECGLDGDDDDTQEFVVSIATPGRAKVGHAKKP